MTNLQKGSPTILKELDIDESRNDFVRCHRLTMRNEIPIVLCTAQHV